MARMGTRQDRIVPSLMAVAVALMTMPAIAQEAADQPATQVGDIIVTANKREESLNRVGLTITAISGDELAQRRITSLQDVAAARHSLNAILTRFRDSRFVNFLTFVRCRAAVRKLSRQIDL